MDFSFIQFQIQTLIGENQFAHLNVLYLLYEDWKWRCIRLLKWRNCRFQELKSSHHQQSPTFDYLHSIPNLPFALSTLTVFNALMGLFGVTLHDKTLNICVFSPLPPFIFFPLTLIFLLHLPLSHSLSAVDSLPCRALISPYYWATKCWNKSPSVIIRKLCQFHVFKKKLQWI